jgi:hypothetical protein
MFPPHNKEKDRMAAKKKAAKKPKKVADHAKSTATSKVADKSLKSSGVRLISIRVADFRSLTIIEVMLNDLTVLVGANNAGKTSLLDALQFAIGASRRLLGKEDIRLAKDEADVPKERRAIVDSRAFGYRGKAYFLNDDLDRALSDLDRAIPTLDPMSSWLGDLPAKPVHGAIRNQLFFDWHAQAVKW